MRPIALTALLFTLAASLRADELKTLTPEVNLSGNPPPTVTWIDPEHFLQRKQSGLMKVAAATGEAAPFFDAAKMEAAFAKLPGFDAKSAKAIAAGRHQMNRARTEVLIQNKGSLYHYAFGAETATKLTTQALDGVENLELSPDGRAVAFVRGNNIHVIDIETAAARQLTTDGGPKLLNGKLDWIYQEEVYGRGEFKSYWWSPDSKRIAFLQLNETPVKQFTIVDHIPNYQATELENYPKSGAPNPLVKLGIVDVSSAEIKWIDTSKYTNDEPIIARVGWKPDNSKLYCLVTNREQTWVDFNFVDPVTGALETLFRDSSAGWIETDNLERPHWLKDGGFLFSSERSGFRHLYHYDAAGKLKAPVTSGNWEARTLHGVDEANGYVYFSGTEHSPIGSDTYRIKLDGTGMERLTQTEGTHRASFNTDLTQFIDTWSDATTPPQTRLHKADGSLVRVIDENKVAALKQYKLGKPEFLQVKTRDGFLMEAMLLKPADFDPNKKYPVWSHTYSGPHAPSVHNSWSGHMSDQLLAQKGYLIWVCDNRSASGKGAQSAWTSYKQLGVQELKDLEDGVAYLKTLPYVDGSRIGLTGWSFGGFMTTYAMTHSKVFKVGIAGGSVTDWNLYDSIYTERYMLMPKNNPDGYAKTSVIKAAKDLSGKLLLIHGTMDDNVHMQNTLQFVYELEKAGKQFDLMLYPKSRHGVGDPQLSRHMQELTTKYILDNL